MNKNFFLSIVVGICLQFNLSKAQICNAPIVDKTTYNLDGIGDGCTIKKDTGAITFNAAWIPNIYFFKDLFTPSCDRHDKCLTQIGNLTGDCNSEFRNLMRNACDNKYPWYRPAENFECKNTAQMYYEVVSAAQTENDTKSLQRASQEAANILADQVVNQELCGTTPERTQLYSNNYISEVNNVFYLVAGRAPTIYEFFALAKATNYVDYRDNWSGWLSYFASVGASTILPSVNYSSSTDFGLRLTAPSNQQEHLWSVNNFRTQSSALTLVNRPPRYNLSVNVKGFYRAKNQYNVRNMVVIDRFFLIQGSCGTNPGQACF